MSPLLGLPRPYPAGRASQPVKVTGLNRMVAIREAGIQNPDSSRPVRPSRSPWTTRPLVTGRSRSDALCSATRLAREVCSSHQPAHDPRPVTGVHPHALRPTCGSPQSGSGDESLDWASKDSLCRESVVEREFHASSVLAVYPFRKPSAGLMRLSPPKSVALFGSTVTIRTMCSVCRLGAHECIAQGWTCLSIRSSFGTQIRLRAPRAAVDAALVCARRMRPITSEANPS